MARILKEELEKLVQVEPKLKKNCNWGNEMTGRSGVYIYYNMMFDDRFGSTQCIIVKEYKRGGYSVLMDRQYDFYSVDEVLEQIPKFLPQEKLFK